MYPFKDDTFTYPYNQWYIAGWSTDFRRELVKRTILGCQLVFFRTLEGEPVSLSNRCPHRGYPLSESRLSADEIHCGYHGFAFNNHGKCTLIPSQDEVPKRYGVRSYPVSEAWNWVWIWMGDPALADPAAIPNLERIKVDSAGWKAIIGGTVHLHASYQTLNENLLDLSHLSFLHADSIGSDGVARAPIKVDESQGVVQVTRSIKGDSLEGVPLGQAAGVEGLIDRTMVQQFFAPSLHATGSDFDSAMDGGVDPGKNFGSLRVLHGVTPETHSTTHYFWAFTRNFGLEDDELTEKARTVVEAALTEDIAALEAIQRLVESETSLSSEISAQADAAAMKGRKLMESLIREERA